MSINSASDVQQLNLARDRLSVKIPMISSSQVKTTTAPTSEATPITGGLAKPPLLILLIQQHKLKNNFMLNKKRYKFFL